MDNKHLDTNQLQALKPADISWEAWNRALANAGSRPNFGDLARTATMFDQQDQHRKEESNVALAGLTTSNDKNGTAETTISEYIQHQLDVLAGGAFTTTKNLLTIISKTQNTAERLFGKGKLAEHMTDAAVTGAMIGLNKQDRDKNLDKFADTHLRMLHADKESRDGIEREYNQLEQLSSKKNGMSPEQREAEIQRHRENAGEQTWEMIKKHRGDNTDTKKYADTVERNLDENLKKDKKKPDFMPTDDERKKEYGKEYQQRMGPLEATRMALNKFAEMNIGMASLAAKAVSSCMGLYAGNKPDYQALGNCDHHDAAASTAAIPDSALRQTDPVSKIKDSTSKADKPTASTLSI